MTQGNVRELAAVNLDMDRSIDSVQIGIIHGAEFRNFDKGK